jgi:hypothetical protein
MDLTSVDENLRPLYEEKAGKFVLKVEPVEGYALENITGLQSSLIAARQERDTAKTALKPFENIDPTAARSALDRVALFEGLDPADVKTKLAGYERLAALDPAAEADKLAAEKVKNATTQLRTAFDTEKNQLTTELTDTKTRLSKREQQVQQLLKTNAIATELAKANPLDEARDALELIASNAVKLKEVNGELVPVVVDSNGMERTKLGADYSSVPFSVADLVAELRNTRAVLFKPDAAKAGIGTDAGGGGARQNAGNDPSNPFSKSGWNMTKQMVMTKSDPTRAARLKAEAGA